MSIMYDSMGAFISSRKAFNIGLPFFFNKQSVMPGAFRTGAISLE